MNIVISCDDAYIFPARILIDSIAAHNQNVDLWLICDDVSEENLAALKQQTDGYRWKFHPVRIPERFVSLASGLPCSGHITKVAYYRLLTPWVMPDCERALYLDSDMLVRGSLEDLYLTDFSGGYLAGAVLDMSKSIRRERKERLSLKGDYFNSGMQLLQLGLIRQQMTEEQMLDQIRTISEEFELIYHDQDVFNKIYDGKIQKIDRKYNYGSFISISYKLKNRNELRDAVIVHFITSYKPWKNEYCLFYMKEYWNYLKKYLTKEQQREYWMHKPLAYCNLAKGVIITVYERCRKKL